MKLVISFFVLQGGLGWRVILACMSKYLKGAHFCFKACNLLSRGRCCDPLLCFHPKQADTQDQKHLFLMITPC